MYNLNAAQVAQFESNIRKDEPDRCWFWLGEINDEGFGFFDIGGVTRNGLPKTARSYRIAFNIANPMVDIAKKVLTNKCGNKLCCNPAHIVFGRVGGAKKTNAPYKERSKEQMPKFDGRQIRQLRALANSGVTAATLVKTFGHTEKYLQAIIDGKYYNRGGCNE